tara:strand:- start:136 stop:774 length:639 start_codon:yes stop_codon:yes gene_type:complete
MVVRCAQNSIEAGLDTLVCTNSLLIIDACTRYNIESVLTPDFNTGTDRVNWAAGKVKTDLIMNLQGDEPLISKEAIKSFAKEIISNGSNNQIIMNGVTPLDQSHAFDTNNVKAILDGNMRILYLTRKPVRNTNDQNIFPLYLKQLGMYGFSKSNLSQFSKLSQGRLETTESVEMLRWIENGRLVKGSILQTPSISVDTPEDLVEVEEILAKN